jgi:pimeloyl-ACP methyl ester carboxylesterase
VRLNADDLRALALGTTGRTSSRRGARTWAADLLALLGGDFERAAQAKLARAEERDLPTASFFMLDCGSGISPARLARLRGDPAARLVGDLSWWYQSACAAWDADLGEEFRAGFVSDVPTVIVQGTWDTNTPFENALELLPSFRDARFIPVEGGSHGALEEALDHSEDFRRALFAFVATGERAALPEEVRLPPLDWAGPFPAR